MLINIFMKKKVWIFGDSFSDPSYKLNDTISWPFEIANKYDVINFSYSGTGPDWSLELLQKNIKQLDKSSLKNINLIFFISCIYRFNFNFYNHHGDQVLSKFIISWGTLNKHVKREIKQYLPYQNFCKKFFSYYANSNLFEEQALLKIIGNLKLYEPMFNKILVWPLFQEIDLPVSSNNFCYVDKSLSSYEKSYGYHMDNRNNHLSPENHEIMLEQLSNWIDHNKPIESSKFQITR